MIKKTLAYSSLVVLGVAVGQWLALASQRSRSVPTASPTIEQVRNLATLLTHRVEVCDVQRTTLSGYTGSVRAALIVKGDVPVGVDLSHARFDRVDHAARHATLILPPPTVGAPRVDHSRTRLWAISHQGLWQVVPGDRVAVAVVNEAYERAQHVIRAAGEQPDLMERSRRQAEGVLRAFFAALGWDVAVRWSDRMRTLVPHSPSRVHHG